MAVLPIVALGILFMLYLLLLRWRIGTHRSLWNLEVPGPRVDEPWEETAPCDYPVHISSPRTIGLLSILAIGLAAPCIYALISGIQESGLRENTPEYFLSIVLLPILANTPVFFLGMQAASDGNYNLAMELNCAAGIEITYIMIPLLITMGLVSGRQVPLDFPLTELLFLCIASLITNRAIVAHGRMDYFQGALLLCLYVNLYHANFENPSKL
jgi:calcium/proton exchanger cax